MLRPIPIVSTIVFLTIQILFSQRLLSQPPIVLRDLTLIRGKTVSEFDRSWITLSDGSTLQWDEVLKATLTSQTSDGDPSLSQTQRQTKFDTLLNQIGLPIYRLKTRIRQGDWAGAGRIAEPIFDSAMAETFTFPNPNVEYLVCVATMKSRAGQGSGARSRAGGVLPFLRASSIQNKVDQKTLELSGTNGIVDKTQNAISPELLPIWFDIDQVRTSAKQIAKLDSELRQSDAGASTTQAALAIYLASMQIELGQNELANANLNRLGSNQNNSIATWSTVLRARMLQKAGDHVRAQAMLDRNSRSLVGDARPVAIYYRGLSEFEIHNTKPNQNQNPLNAVVDTELSKSSLMLMRLPAIYGDSNPEIAAAGLYQAAMIAKLRGQTKQSKNLLRELLQRYPRTYHGSLEQAGTIAQ